MTTSAAGVLARLQVARARLNAADPVIAGLIDRRPDYDPRHRLDGIPPMDLFGALVFQVTGQQLSVASRRRILDRIQEMFGGHMPSPAELLQADPAGLRQAGLSGRKISTLRDLAERLTDGRLNVDALSALPDKQIIAQLTQVPGIGPWTVQGALILELNREDVVLPGDLALRKAMRDAYQLDHLPTPDEVLAIAERWRPHRSLATLHLFRARESTAAVKRSVPRWTTGIAIFEAASESEAQRIVAGEPVSSGGYMRGDAVQVHRGGSGPDRHGRDRAQRDARGASFDHRRWHGAHRGAAGPGGGAGGRVPGKIRGEVSEADRAVIERNAATYVGLSRLHRRGDA